MQDGVGWGVRGPGAGLAYSKAYKAAGGTQGPHGKLAGDKEGHGCGDPQGQGGGGGGGGCGEAGNGAQALGTALASWVPFPIFVLFLIGKFQLDLSWAAILALLP